MTLSEKIRCNSCGKWRRGPYRRGKCARCQATVDGYEVCCGDCDCFPCQCPELLVYDYDIPLLAREAGNDTLIDPATGLEVA